jgi:hypothetical protein
MHAWHYNHFIQFWNKASRLCRQELASFNCNLVNKKVSVKIQLPKSSEAPREDKTGNGTHMFVDIDFNPVSFGTLINYMGFKSSHNPIILLCLHWVPHRIMLQTSLSCVCYCWVAGRALFRQPWSPLCSYSFHCSLQHSWCSLSLYPSSCCISPLAPMVISIYSKPGLSSAAKKDFHQLKVQNSPSWLTTDL